MIPLRKENKNFVGLSCVLRSNLLFEKTVSS